MTFVFISFIAVFVTARLIAVNIGSGIRCDQRCGFSVATLYLLVMGAFLMATTCAVASPQAETPEPPAQPQRTTTEETDTSDDGTASSETSSASEVGDEFADVDSLTTPDDLLIVITREGLNQLIEASGGDIQTFDFSRLKQASSLVPLSENQSQALRPVLQTAASPIMLDRLFHPANVKAIQSFFGGPPASAKAVVAANETAKNEQRDQFFKDHPWINDPGIGQIVAMTRMVEANRPEEIALQVQEKIRESVAERVEELARERFGVDEVDPSLLKESFFDPGKTIVQTAPWEEYLGEDGNRDNAMVQTYVLVELPNHEIESVMAGIRTEIQKKRLVLLCITVGLAWLGIAISSVAFRTFHTQSRFWKLVVIPVLFLAVVPCLTGACLLVGEMATGKLL